MIIEFKVSNFISIHNKQTFSMVAGSGLEIENNVCTTGCDSNFSLVRAAVIYGANASGKSNLLSTLLFMRMFIISSAKESQQGEKIPVASFAFDDASRHEPSEFEITFIKNKIRFQYGFVVDENRIFEEWLFAYPQGKAQRWFTRIYDTKNDKYSWKFSQLFKGGKPVSKLTRSNVLFLSNAVKLNNEQLAPVFDWFQKDLVLIDSAEKGRFGSGHNPTLELLKTSAGTERILQLMLTADPSIADIKFEMIKADEKNINFPSSMPTEVQNYFKKEIINNDYPKINFTHIKEISLDFSAESRGTRQLLEYAGYWIDALDNGRTLIIDELDSSLHPLIVRFLIKLICDPDINKNNAQLIFSTHDTSLLDNELFRRDQIWFVEKDDKNSTQLYPLLEFSPRKNEAVRKGYLEGRYGALPYIGEWRY